MSTKQAANNLNDDSAMGDDDLVLHGDTSCIPTGLNFNSRARRNKSVLYTAADILQHGLMDLGNTHNVLESVRGEKRIISKFPPPPFLLGEIDRR